MLRSRSVSSRRRLRSALFAIVVSLTLFVAARASARPTGRVVVAGPDGSTRVTAIASELRARGFEVVTEGATPTDSADASASVRVDADGSVVVVSGAPGAERREAFPSAEGDAVLARRVAETIRAAVDDVPVEPLATPPPATAPPPPAPPPEPSARPLPGTALPLPLAPLAPARTFASSGTWLLSLDDALPLLSVGAGAPLASERYLRVGDPANEVRTSPKPLSLDLAVADRFTIGGSVLLQLGPSSSIIGGSLRAGYLFPLTDRLAFWPRAGVSFAKSVKDGSSTVDASRTDVVLDARLVWTVTNTWALTFGPTLAVAVQHSAVPPEPETPAYATLNVNAAPSYSSPTDAPPRFGVAIGITGRLTEHADDEREASGPEPRFFFGVERAVPLFRYRIDTASSGDKSLGEGPTTLADGGTVDVTSIVPQSPRFAFDVRVYDRVTVGLAASIGHARRSDSTESLVPKSGAPSTTAFAVAPRVGYRAELSRWFALWPRVGLTYLTAAHERPDLEKLVSYHLGADVDGFAVFSPVRGVGIVFGPSLELPISGARRVVGVGGSPLIPLSQAVVVRRVERNILTFGLSAGLVVALP